MNRCAVVAFCAAAILTCASCWGPKISVEEEKVLTTLSNIQGSLESNIDYQQFIDLLGRAKIEIDILKRSGKNNPCFIGAIDKCYAYYHTGGKAWKQKLETNDESRKNDMDLTLSVLQSQAALSIQMANNCYKNSVPASSWNPSQFNPSIESKRASTAVDSHETCLESRILS